MTIDNKVHVTVLKLRKSHVHLGIQAPDDIRVLRSEVQSNGESKPGRWVKGRILLVEDNPVNQKVQKQLLEGEGYWVDVVDSGEAALEMFSDDYDLVILDIGLPGISGIEVLKSLRARENGKDIPIIALTAHGKLIMDECLSMGFNEVVTKPVINYTEFDELLMSYL